MGWHKRDDTFALEIEFIEAATVSKRTMLKTLASIYDYLDLMSLIRVEGKHLY